MRSKTRSSRKSRKPQENIFQRFSTPSFPFCTVPKTENLEMKTNSEVFHLQVFGLGYRPGAKTKPWSWTNSEFDQNELRLVYIDQNDLDYIKYHII